MKIDIVILTKNSERLLEECLTSIYKEAPVCHLIIVDGFSTDRTLEIVNRFGKEYGNTKIIKTEARLGKARDIGISNVDTEWFAFIDSDVILRKAWFEKIVSHIREEDTEIGALESNFIHHYPEGTPKFPQFNHVVNGKRLDSRGLTITTLIRKKAVEDINIPQDLPLYEDEFVRRWVEKKGFVWLKVAEPIVDHFPRPNPFKDAYLMGIYSRRYNFIFSPWRIVGVSIIFPLKLVYFWMKTKSLRASLNSVRVNFWMLRGLVEETLGISKDKKSW